MSRVHTTKGPFLHTITTCRAIFTVSPMSQHVFLPMPVKFATIAFGGTGFNGFPSPLAWNINSKSESRS
jgi:hypothetical protein